ncbi:hypothetical protein BGZ94_004104 [Podila epigama]|nr:hypothetical protein BGZ94_004104 [Podila epigama]
MKLLLKLSLATALFSSALAGLSLREFVADPKVTALAPHLIREINTQGLESFTTQQPPTITTGLQIPLLDDIIQIVALNIFNPKAADWSRLETAKLKAIQAHGAEALASSANLQDIDAHRALLIANAIYDAVIGIPAVTKESYTKIAAAKPAPAPNADANANANAQPPSEAAEKKEEDAAETEAEPASSLSSTVWNMLGFSITKSQETVKKAKAVVSPVAVCETTDTAYLKGVRDVVYYSSLTHGLAGGVLAFAPDDSPLKSLDLKTIITAVGKLAVEIQMAQSVARLAELNPSDDLVRTMTFLALTADTPTSQDAQSARDLHNLLNKGLADLVPEAVSHTLAEQAALALITRGAGSATVSSPFNSVPILKNVFVFSNEVLNANNIGDVVKYVFCPESSNVPPETADTHAPPKEVAKEADKSSTNDKKVSADAEAQKVLKAPDVAAAAAAPDVISEEVIPDVVSEEVIITEDAKENVDNNNKADQKGTVETIQDKIVETVQKAGEKLSEAKDAVVENVGKLKDAAEKKVDEAKDATAEAKEAAEKKAAEVKEAAEKKAAEVKEATEKKVDEVRDATENKAAEVKDVVEKKVDEAKEATENKAAEVKDATENKAAEVKEAAEKKVNEAADRAQEEGRKVEAKVDEAKEAVKEQVNEAAQKAEEAAKKVQEQTAPKRDEGKEEL